MKPEPARHRVRYGTGSKPEGQFDLCVELEPDQGVGSKWEENWNRTKKILKIQSGFLFKVRLGHPSILEFLFSFCFFPASLDFLSTKQTRACKIFFLKCSSSIEKLRRIFFVLCVQEKLSIKAREEFFSLVPCVQGLKKTPTSKLGRKISGGSLRKKKVSCEFSLVLAIVCLYCCSWSHFVPCCSLWSCFIAPAHGRT